MVGSLAFRGFDRKNGIEPRKMVLWWTLFKTVSAVGFSGKESFLKSMSFHTEIMVAIVLSMQRFS